MEPSERLTLGDALPREIARVQELHALYVSLGPDGLFGATTMRLALEAASRAMIEQDLAAMIAAYRDLQKFTE